jgi:hypothetical protein
MRRSGWTARPAGAAGAGRRQGLRIGLVTAPGGRGLIAAQLQAAGATIERADVYQRRLLRLPPRTLARLAHSAQPWVLAVSSGEALQHFWQQLPPALQQRLQATPPSWWPAIGSANRRALGLQRVVRAPGPPAAAGGRCTRHAHRPGSDLNRDVGHACRCRRQQ